MPGYPPRRIREMDHPLGMRRETLGSSGVVAEPSVLFSSGDGYVGELLELTPSRVSKTLSRLKSKSGISLEMPPQKMASSRLEGRIS